MLSQRNKIIILISGAVVLFALIVVMVFDLFPGSDGEPAIAPAEDLSFLEEAQPAAQGKVFDSANAEEFALMAQAPAGEPVSAAERAAEGLASFFLERFGTYSSDAGTAYIDDLLPFMTPRMRAFVERYKETQKQNQPDGAFAVVTVAGVGQAAEFFSGANSAEFNYETVRTEKTSQGTEEYRQAARVELIQDAAFEWKVDGVFWGNRL